MTLPGGTTLEGGSTVAGYTYDEYGNLESNATQGFLNETTYTGSVTDKSTGLQYMSARYYDAENGRFLTQDTYTGNPYDPWTQHLYAYCGNNPVSMVDPTGHWPFNIGEIIDNAKKILNRMLNSLLTIPFKPVITKGSAKEQKRSTQYSSGYKQTKWFKSDTFKNKTPGASDSMLNEAYGYKGIQAQAAFAWYIGAEGAPKEFSLPQAYNEEPAIRNSVDSEIKSQQLAATRIGQTKNGRYVISSETYNTGAVTNMTSDWYYAIKKYQVSGAAIVMKKGNDYAMLSKITIYDRYNFDTGEFEALGRMAETGMAYNYDHSGYYYKFSTWTTGG